MGSPCEIHVYAQNAAVATRAISAASEDIVRLEQKFSRYLPGNLFDQVNQAAASGAHIDVDDEFIALLEYADACHQQSDGLFDVTSGILRKVWDFKKPEIRIPDQSEIDKLIKSVGWQYVSWSGTRLSFERTGMELDFGGIVKEYAVDRAATICEENGIRHGLIDLGGDMFFIGPHPDERPWDIYARHPRHADKSYGRFQISRGGLASSGDYERKIEINHQRYCHILSPKSGWPTRGLAGVTVVAPQCVVAGSACTTAMLMEQNGPAWLQELGLPYLCMDANQKVFSDSRAGDNALVLKE